MSNGNGMVPVLVPPQFAKFMAEFFGDKRNVLWPVANISKLPLPLDAAQPFAEKEIEGDFIYADSDSSGVIYVRFNNPAMPEIPVRTNFGIYGFPIKRIFVRWDAQAGKQINLLYGYGAQVIPPNQDITSIGAITNPVTLSTWLGKNRTYSPGFIAGGSIAAVAAQVSYVRFDNPAASGITAYIDRIVGTSSGNNVTMEIRVGVTPGAGALVGINKRIGSAAPVSRLAAATTAALGGTTVAARRSMNGDGQVEWIFEEPIIVPANQHVVFDCSVVNQPFDWTVEWREG